MSKVQVMRCASNDCDQVFRFEDASVWWIRYTEDWYLDHISVVCPVCSFGHISFKQWWVEHFHTSNTTVLVMEFEYAEPGVAELYERIEKLPAVTHARLTKRQQAILDYLRYELNTEEAFRLIQECV